MPSTQSRSGANRPGLLSRGLKMLEIPVKDRQTLTVLRNPDILPIPAEDCTWSFFSYLAYWGVISFSVGTWVSANAALDVGLSYAETIGTFIVGDAVTIVFTLANSYHGLDWRVGYTLSQRFVFGIYGSGLGILVRILMSIVNYGSNAWLGGLCVNMILDSFSHHYVHLPNTLTHKVAMSTKELIGFVLFHVITAFFYLMKPKSMNYFLIWSCVATCFGMMGMVIYLTKINGGVGSAFRESETTIHGSDRAWMWVYMVSYWFGSVSPGSTNQSDYSRFASNKTGLYLGVIVALLVPTTVVPVFGVIGASTTSQLYGDAIWTPMDIFNYWLKENYSAGARAASFFCGVAFTASQISYTISNCGFASGMDLSGVLPQYINIFRGAIFTALVSVAVQPWNFYNKDSNTFLSVMSSFGVVMTPIISVMIADNFLVRKRKYSVSQAFVLKGEYYYTLGTNWRAMAAFVCGMAPGLPGIAAEANANIMAKMDRGIVNFFYADSFTSFAISFFMYWILCLIFPVKIGIEQDDKDYFGAFTDEEARERGVVPFSELTPEEIEEHNFSLGALDTPHSSSASSTGVDAHYEGGEKTK
ncbi:Thiamine transporter thi7 [Lachancea thermotolerans]|uniref:KLTH0F08162p n=1 Tax=Lachancea thermotolerans (strain ATCC 56472 / CBS 6340 / NRRL Y-8284) TaxID=559295 RepID=C5DKW9_LACTC|nr:KLTH0F08162p [Lachancea thermotolerans CBS 6340]CAR24120.1 KLTH0F08162p [Lachancea thermotolerans CBS 6340]